MKSYSELIELDGYQPRLEYLMVNNMPFEKTFGGLRHINQNFYRSREWKNIRNAVIDRDLGRDLGVPGMDIIGPIYVHHINPINPKVLFENPRVALDLEFLISTSFYTHQLIHYGSWDRINRGLIVERSRGDTDLW